MAANGLDGTAGFAKAPAAAKTKAPASTSKSKKSASLLQRQPSPPPLDETEFQPLWLFTRQSSSNTLMTFATNFSGGRLQSSRKAMRKLGRRRWFVGLPPNSANARQLPPGPKRWRRALQQAHGCARLQNCSRTLHRVPAACLITRTSGRRTPAAATSNKVQQQQQHTSTSWPAVRPRSRAACASMLQLSPRYGAAQTPSRRWPGWITLT